MGRSCLALLWELGLSSVLILINGTIAHEGRWIFFSHQHGIRIWVTGLETVFGVTDSLRLYLGVTDSPLVGDVTWIILRTDSWRDHPGWTCATKSKVWAWPDLVSDKDKFCMCQIVVWGRLVYAEIAESEMGSEWGELPFGSTWHKRGSLEFNGKLL
jgi:hypothetical protein